MLRLGYEYKGRLVNADLVLQQKMPISNDEIDCYLIEFHPPVRLRNGFISMSPMKMYVRADGVFWPDGIPVDESNPERLDVASIVREEVRTMDPTPDRDLMEEAPGGNRGIISDDVSDEEARAELDANLEDEEAQTSADDGGLEG